MFYKALADKLLKIMSKVERGTLSLKLPDGKHYEFEGSAEGVHARIEIHDLRAIKLFILRGNVGLGETYRDGLWSTPDLVNCLIFGLQNEHLYSKFENGNFLFRIATVFFQFASRNTLKGSKKNIYHHYDLSNEFFKLWLDPGMSYSSALFDDQHPTLEQAQHNKYDRILDKLEAPSGKLLEIGCGWGGLVERALEKYDFDIKGITLSSNQHSYARERLGDRAQISIEDYREQEGTYNHIVSIEMFEAVGEKYWPVYFNKVKSLLADKGKALIQVITLDEKHYKQYRHGNDFMRTHIFPGGMLPSPERFNQAVSNAELQLTESFFFGNDYAKTLKLWLKAFEERKPEVKNLGFDDVFIRLWKFYLCSCIAGFEEGKINVMQAELQHA